MVREKQSKESIKMKVIERSRNRCIKLRRGQLMKKAQEISVLCTSEVAVIIFTKEGELIEYSSTSNISGTLSRYAECQKIHPKGKEQDDQAQKRSRQINKRVMRIEEKLELAERLREMPLQVAAPMLHSLRGKNPNLMLEDDAIEIDIDALDPETLWELEHFLADYNNASKTSEQEQTENPASVSDPKKKEAKKTKDVKILRNEVATLQTKYSKLMGGDLSAVGLKELLQLEQELISVLYSIQDRKEQIFMDKLEKSRTKQNELMLENESLTKQVENLKSFFEPSKHTQPLFIENLPQSPVDNPNAKDVTERRGTIRSVDNEPHLYSPVGSTSSTNQKLPEEETDNNSP